MKEGTKRVLTEGKTILRPATLRSLGSSPSCPAAERLSERAAPFMTVGRVYSKLGDYGEALRWISKGLVNEPQHAGLQAARATLLAVLGKRDEALEAAQLLG